MKVKIKKLNPSAFMPVYSTDGSGCFDLRAISMKPNGDTCEYGTGLAFSVPKDHVMLIFSRSGHGFNNNIRLVNCVGVIDSDYRGEVSVKLTRDNGYDQFPWIGDKVAQAMVLKIPKITFEEVDELDETKRGGNGFGSTGK